MYSRLSDKIEETPPIPLHFPGTGTHSVTLSTRISTSKVPVYHHGEFGTTGGPPQSNDATLLNGFHKITEPRGSIRRAQVSTGLLPGTRRTPKGPRKARCASACLLWRTALGCDGA